jgi:hypothetical protein
MKLVPLIHFFAQVSSPMFDELTVSGAILLTMAGLGLHLYQPRHQMSVEERVKDSKMSEDEARRQMRFYRMCAPAVTLIGVMLLSLAIFDMSQ